METFFLLTNGEENVSSALFFSKIMIETGRGLLFRKDFSCCSVNIFSRKLIFPSPGRPPIT